MGLLTLAMRDMSESQIKIATINFRDVRSMQPMETVKMTQTSCYKIAEVPSCENYQRPDKCYDVCHNIPYYQPLGSCSFCSLHIIRCKPGYVRTRSDSTRRCVRAHGFSTKYV
ncbi:unnamed protein product [Meganyctiphanes norvegica]|uniref:Uncharacterized protein n=1 Tax=Meganyctiphanes norvegica TaxID=48144 RepID=A0AAV2RCJ4_MEGNR